MDESTVLNEYTWDENLDYAWKHTNKIFINDLHSPFRIAAKYVHTKLVVINVLKYSKRSGSAILIIHFLKTKRIFSIKKWDHIWQISMEVPDGHSNPIKTLKFELKWHDDIMINSVHPDFYMHTKDLWMNEQFSDVTIVIDEEEIPAHKFVLTYLSPVFFAMLNANMKENQTRRIEIKDVQLDVMKQVLSYMYTGELPISKEDCDGILHILVVADMYELNALIKMCEDELYKFLELENALKIFKFASLYHLTNLRNDSIDFIIHRLQTITKMDEFQQLSHEHPDIFKEVVLAIHKDDSPPGVLQD